VHPSPLLAGARNAVVAIEVVIAAGFKVPVQVFARRTEKEVYRLSKPVSSSEPVV
jgi:hypothetical protein